MSIEATKWARLANVEKSSSKLILLNLAMLVRYDAEEWTVFASIEYLSKVTHLNRKTVIEALSRLRKLGAIQDTGHRTGENRSCIVYRLCPNAVPLVGLPPAFGVNAGNVSASTQTEPDDGGAGPSNEPDGEPDHDRRVSQAVTPAEIASAAAEEVHEIGCAAVATGVRQALVKTDHEPTAAERPGRLRHGQHAAAAGAAPTRLPAGWTLPERWRVWAARERPHWNPEKIDAMAATFAAYMRSRPGDAGMSSDWFESWRLWVFREWEPKASRTPWHATWGGIVAKGKSLGLSIRPNEPEAWFKQRVFQAAGMPPPH